jgi:hypothetical protein
MARDLTATTLNSFHQHGLTQAAFLLPPLQQQPPFLSVLCGKPPTFPDGVQPPDPVIDVR